MELRNVRLDRGLMVSLGLSLAIVGVGTCWVLAHPSQPSRPARHSVAYGVQSKNLTRVAGISELIVEGVVKEVYPAEWTTRDKNAPADMREALGDPSIQLRTPVLLEVEEVVKGRGVPGTVLFTLPGGTSGDVTVSSPFGFAPEVGQRVLVFLSTAPKGSGPWSEISPLYPQIFFIVDGEKLHGPEATISRSSLMLQIGSEGKP